MDNFELEEGILMPETESLIQFALPAQNFPVFQSEVVETAKTKEQLQAQLEELKSRLDDSFYGTLKEIGESKAVKTVLKSSPLGIFCGRRPKLFLAAVVGATLTGVAELVFFASGSALIKPLASASMLGGIFITSICFFGWLIGIRLTRNGRVFDWPRECLGYKPAAKVWLLERVQSGVNRATAKFISQTEKKNFVLRKKTEELNYFCEVLEQLRLTEKDQNEP